MDLTGRSTWWKLRKGARYARLYGPRRTLAKSRAQYHMRRRYSPLPAQAEPPPPGGHVGIIGCGSFAYSTLAYYLQRTHGDVLRAAMDIDVHRAASLAEAYGARYYTDDADRLLGDPAIDLVVVASYHSSHADYAVRALEAGKHVHVEKPHVLDESELRRLCAAMGASSGKLALGFNRPLSPHSRVIQGQLASQPGAAVLNWSVFGHPIPPDHWYARPEEGGRVFGNLCHWIDFLYRLVPADGRYPIRVVPVRDDMPDADLAVCYVFGDGTVAAITFSSKGQTFEGVRETFSAQRGDVMLWLSDFERTVVERAEHRSTFRTRGRDNGHEARVEASYGLTRGDPGESVRTVWETGELVIRTDEALRRNEEVVVGPFAPEQL